MKNTWVSPFKKLNKYSYFVPANYMQDARMLQIGAQGEAKKPFKFSIKWGDEQLLVEVLDGVWWANVVLMTRKNGYKGQLSVDAHLPDFHTVFSLVELPLDEDAVLAVEADGLANLTITTVEI